MHANFGKVLGPSLGLVGELRLPWINGRLVLGIEAGFYYSSRTTDVDMLEERARVRIVGTPIMARVAYGVILSPVEIRVGAGIGVVASQTRITSPELGATARTDAAFAGTPFATLRKRFGRSAPPLETGYSYAPLDSPQLRGHPVAAAAVAARGTASQNAATRPRGFLP